MTDPIPAALAIWLGAVNLWAFSAMGLDKRRARQGSWRISERALFLPALLGGSAGAILGMRTFRHKTRHWYFHRGLPALLLAQIGLGCWAALRLF